MPITPADVVVSLCSFTEQFCKRGHGLKEKGAPKIHPYLSTLSRN